MPNSCSVTVLWVASQGYCIGKVHVITLGCSGAKQNAQHGGVAAEQLDSGTEPPNILPAATPLY